MAIVLGEAVSYHSSEPGAGPPVPLLVLVQPTSASKRSAKDACIGNMGCIGWPRRMPHIAVCRPSLGEGEGSEKGTRRKLQRYVAGGMPRELPIRNPGEPLQRALVLFVGVKRCFRIVMHGIRPQPVR